MPEPVATVSGELISRATVTGVPGIRICSLLHWVEGHSPKRGVDPDHFRSLGILMANLHDHARKWNPPQGFTRRSWDWDGLFGDSAGFNLPAKTVWALVPDKYRLSFIRVADKLKKVMNELGKTPDVFGLIHADLLIGEDGNVIFKGSEARPIDFDDCGYGY